MNDRLSTLLHVEAAALDVPSPPVADILAIAHRRRRRGRIAASAIVVASVVAVAMAGGLVLAHRDQKRVVDPAKIAQFEQWGAVAVGRDVYVGDVHVRSRGKVTAMYYTSQGVVVRSSGDYSLIRADGQASAISVDIPDRLPGFEPDSTRFAYVEPRGGNRWDVVVHDVATDEELSRTEIAGPPYGGWTAPPAAIDGDRAWVHLRDHWVEVDWRTGAVRDVPGTRDTYELANGSYAVQAGRYASRHGGAWQVRRWSDGGLVGTAALGRDWYAFFSPDGRYLRAFSQGRGDPPDRIYDPVTGASATVPADDVGWTPGGNLLIVQDGRLRVCVPLTDDCRSRVFDGGAADLRIGGNPYES